MVCRLIDFALVTIKLLMLKIYVIIVISKIKLFNFSRTDTVKKIKKFKNHSKLAKFVSQSFFKQFQQIPNFLLVFY